MSACFFAACAEKRAQRRCGRWRDAHLLDLNTCADVQFSPLFSAFIPFPLSLPPHSFADFESEIWASYVDQKTDVQGVSTGWEALDGLYRVSCGEGWRYMYARGVARHRSSPQCVF